MNVYLEGNSTGAELAANSNSIAIVVDTLRASTTLPIAMHKGLKELYIAKEVEDARLAAKQYNTILMGERGCIKLPGFAFGNSPTEIYSLETFPFQSVTFTSSTGARIVIESINSSLIIIGSPINAKAVVKVVTEYLKKQKKDIFIIPAFSNGSIITSEITEDQLGGIIIAKEFLAMEYKLSNKITNEIKYLDKLLENSALENLFQKTQHGQKLLNLSFSDDVEFCSRINFVNDVPVSENKIKEISSGEKIVFFENKKIKYE